MSHPAIIAQLILEKIQELSLVDKCTIEEPNTSPEVWFSSSFTCGPDQEAGDVGWDLYVEIQIALRAQGLKINPLNGGNIDHDTVWGQIIVDPEQPGVFHIPPLPDPEPLILPGPPETITSNLDLV